ncbi:MAG: RagB/SusD family nutrient uptake outer membrane protein [Chitinophagaceae bacterium]|nr:RagB/SusD family nutrient uptake outer membrane protein [Chitinophagaceae bacterium]
MKQKLVIITFLSSLLFSCDLNEKILDTPTSETFLRSQNDVQFLVNGIYGTIASNNMFRIGGIYPYLYAADDLSAYGDTRAAFSQKFYTSATAELNNLWRGYYQVINSANTLMESIPNVQMDEAYRNRILGELHFLRGWMYLDMVRFFGGIPVRTQGTSGGKGQFEMARSSVSETYTLIFADLENAAQACLPASQMPATESGHATKGAAQGLLALAHLTYGNYLDLTNQNGAAEHYELASSWANSVILSGEYSLLNNYADLWDVDKENAAYREVIFSIRESRDAAVGAGAGGSGYASLAMPNTFYNTTGKVSVNRTGEGSFKVQPWFCEKYRTGEYTGDFRGEFSFLTRWVENGVNGKYRIAFPDVRILPGTDETPEDQPYINKYRDPKGLGTFNCENDFFYLRLAEVYLIKAEAENELNGPTAEAYAAFNKLRERARLADGTVRATPADLTPGLSKEQFRLKIFDERGLELVAEGHRWFDLVRMRYIDNSRTMMEYIFDEFIKTIPQGAPVFNTAANNWGGGRTTQASIYPAWNAKFLLFPVPDAELNTNTLVAGNQNPGW